MFPQNINSQKVNKNGPEREKKGKILRCLDLNKRIVSTLVIATILLSLAAFVPMSNAEPSGNVMKPNLDKLAPNLRAEIEANPTGDNRIIIVLQPGVDQTFAKNYITNLGGTVSAQYDIINAISATLSADKILPLTSLVGVDKILVDGKKYLPPDPLGDDGGSQPVPGPDPTAYYAQFPFWIGADKAWDLGIHGEGVVVAVLDTGIWYEHPDLAGVIVNPATDYKVFTSEVDAFPHDVYGHGTACTGLVAAQGILTYYGFLKVLGVAPGAKVIGGKVLTDEGWGWDSWIINGIEWAVTSGANIITMSLGGLEVPNDGYDPTSLALEAATQQGVTCFIAAANSQGAGTVSSPGVASHVITVGASTENSGIWNVVYYWPTRPTNVTGYENDQMIFWSSGGATEDGRLDPDICAPGAWGETLDTYPYYVWLQFGGTSMATPVAAGAGALVLQAYKQAHGVFPSPCVVKEILMNTAKDLGYPANRQGAGRVDAEKAVQAALNSAPYSDTDYISKMIPAGMRSAPTWSTFTDIIDSAQAVKLQYVDSVSFTGLTVLRGLDNFPATNNYWLTFTIPQGVEFADVQVKFPPEFAYGTPIHSYNGTTWKDAHINTALYNARNGDPNDLILINYAYAHTNVQWLDARIDFGPGTYVLRFWNTGGPAVTISPVDVQVTFYKFVPWDWVSTTKSSKKLLTTMSVPSGTAPGIYSGFVKATVSGSPIDLPIVITVPAKLGQTFTVQTDVMNEPRTGDSGDWFYIPVKAFTIGNLMLTVTWTTADADFDAYIVNPTGQVRASSYAPHAIAYSSPPPPGKYTGGGGRKWYTTTGTTMEMLSTFSLFPGYWYVGIHAIYFGNTFSQTVTVKLDQGTPINTPEYLTLKRGTSKTFTVSNKIPGTVNVQTMALQFAMETYTSSTTGTVASFDGTNQGYVEIDFPVTPDMITMTVSLSWAGGHSLSLVLWDPAGRNVGDTFTNPGSLTVINPVIGWWGAIITINDVGSQDFTLTVSGQRFKALSGVTITPATFTLAPMGTQAVTITASLEARGAGFIVYYDLATGSVYSETLVIISPCGGFGKNFCI
jgi:subtilisin family serine protease